MRLPKGQTVSKPIFRRKKRATPGMCQSAALILCQPLTGELNTAARDQPNDLPRSINLRV
jgi:hypothetical protein